VVDSVAGRRLGLTGTTALLLNAGTEDPADLASKVRRVAGGVAGTAAEVDLLAPPAASPVAFLTGSRATKAFGAFSYRFFPDGTLQPDRAWVASSITTATVPILGRVTCGLSLGRRLAVHRPDALRDRRAAHQPALIAPGRRALRRRAASRGS
jgi:hypothetical protein